MIDLKYWRKKRNLTRIQLASILGISQNYIYEIETGKKYPSVRMLCKLIKALDICIIVTDARKCNCSYSKCKKCFEKII